MGIWSVSAANGDLLRVIRIARVTVHVAQTSDKLQRRERQDSLQRKSEEHQYGVEASSSSDMMTARANDTIPMADLLET